MEFPDDHACETTWPGPCRRQLDCAQANGAVVIYDSENHRTSRQAGVPDGMFNVIAGLGHIAGKPP
jgi:hypothetical protein